MFIEKYLFTKKCNFEMCQNVADYKISTGKGDFLICDECLKKLKSQIKKITEGAQDVRKK